MSAIDNLRQELKDPEYSEGYAESFLDSYIATQIKVLREQAKLSQKELADIVGTGQAVISRIENVNYSKWNITTLKRLARAFRVRLKVSFETYGSLLEDVSAFSRGSLERTPRQLDPILNSSVFMLPTKRRRRHAKRCIALKYQQSFALTAGAMAPTSSVFLESTGEGKRFGSLSSEYSAPSSAAAQAMRLM